MGGPCPATPPSTDRTGEVLIALGKISRQPLSEQVAHFQSERFEDRTQFAPGPRVAFDQCISVSSLTDGQRRVQVIVPRALGRPPLAATSSRVAAGPLEGIDNALHWANGDGHSDPLLTHDAA